MEAVIPHAAEDAVIVCDDRSCESHVHVTPPAIRRPSVYVIVGDVHTSRIAHAFVNGDDLAVVAVVGMVDPRELDRVELTHIDAHDAYGTQMPVLQRCVIAAVAEAVVHGIDIHSGVNHLSEKCEERLSDAVVAEVKVLKIYTPPRFAYVGKHEVELLAAC